MDLRTAFTFGCNIVGIRKNNKNYGMVCSWCSQVNTEEIIMTIGTQSETGRQIEAGDLVGISVLSDSQKKLAMTFGFESSKENDKFSHADYSLQNDTALLINDSHKKMVVQILKVIQIDTKNYTDVYHAKIVSFEEDKNKKSLLLDDFINNK